ncbi:hypothetical protein IWQ57_001255 [Coemansia nantahalensis]|uniref:Uncharacterized protein n=1 Tax=Coemansia nantahalensis TaxID=2789366 RepID=A0ACC1K4Y6_9FUNG|nr:hypothetical protein IWQ57_001255 [Coemansia nantahalensis]
MKIIDIGANLTDPVFRGRYRGTQAHADDLGHLLARARAAGVVGMMVTGGSLSESAAAVELCGEAPGLFATVGCHPTRSTEPQAHAGGADAYFAALRALIDGNRARVVAVGECGLDYDRLQFADKEAQARSFVRHFALAEATGLPMFLHSRNAAADFARLVRENRHRFSAGVVHSFTGGAEEARELLDLGLYIGINGCSLKTDENLAVVRALPLDRLMVETDCPYCEIRRTHASHALLPPAGGAWTPPEAKRKERWDSGSMVKSRNEPCMIRQVLAVLARLHSVDEAEVARRVFDNTRRVFFGGIEHEF